MTMRKHTRQLLRLSQSPGLTCRGYQSREYDGPDYHKTRAIRYLVMASTTVFVSYAIFKEREPVTRHVHLLQEAVVDPRGQDAVAVGS